MQKTQAADNGNAGKRLRLKEKYLRKKIGMAIRDYSMIRKGDRLLVCVSGGQDSLTALSILASPTVRKSLDISITALHVQTDLKCPGCVHKDRLVDIFEGLSVEYVFERASVINKDGKVNCFWCSWNKRKAIFMAAERLGCNKVVFGHHKDDIIETMLLNLFFNGEISTMNPKQVMFGGKITIIRPLAYLEKKEITSYAKTAGFVSHTCKCPYGEFSKRKFVREIIENAQKTSSVVKSNIFRAPSRIREGYLGSAEGESLIERSGASQV